jgi:glycosyltransferase involved in cell wall biosynthesis
MACDRPPAAASVSWFYLLVLAPRKSLTGQHVVALPRYLALASSIEGTFGSPPGVPPTAMTRIATIIPAHNAERFIEATLASAARSGTDRIIVSLDRCTDRTEDIVRQSGADVVITHSPVPGVSAARNHGASLAKDCCYLRFVDADDLVRPASARMLAYVLHANRAAVAAFGNVAHIDVNGSPAYAAGERSEDLAFISGDLLVPLLAGNLIDCPSIVVLRREAFEQIGGFATDLSHAEDWHLWTRLATQGEYMHVRRVVADYRIHSGSASLNDSMSPAPYLESVSSLYADPRIRRAVPQATLAAARPLARANIYRFLGDQAMRKRSLAQATSWYLRSSMIVPKAAAHTCRNLIDLYRREKAAGWPATRAAHDRNQTTGSAPGPRA